MGVITRPAIRAIKFTKVSFEKKKVQNVLLVPLTRKISLSCNKSWTLVKIQQFKYKVYLFRQPIAFFLMGNIPSVPLKNAWVW